MPEIKTLKDFDLSGATVSLWVFKKTVPAGRPPKFTGRWVHTTDPLDQALRNAVATERDRITEIQDYGLLAQNNECSALSITTLETHAGLFLAEAAAEIPGKQVGKLKDIQNTSFYVIKFVAGDNIMFAVRKTDASWRAKIAKNIISVLFSDNQLTLDEDPGFNISRYIDFFVIGDDIFISQKPNFEAVLNFKAAHQEDFVALQQEPAFTAVFADLNVLLSYVGDNKIQLRRVAAIRQKGHYKDPKFMQNLKDKHVRLGLKLVFDNTGRIVPSLECCKDIFQALLDHRLTSEFSNNIYDVPDAANIAG